MDASHASSILRVVELLLLGGEFFSFFFQNGFFVKRSVWVKAIMKMYSFVECIVIVA